MRTRRPIFVCVALLLLAGCNGGGDVGDAPRPADLSVLDPEVAGLIQQTLTEVDGSPADAALRTRLGMVYQANELFDEALAVFQQGLQLDPSQPVAWYHTARLQHRLGDVEAGIVSMGRSIKLKSDYVPSFWRRGGWHFDNGAFNDAEADFRKALSLEPDNLQARLGMVRVTLENGQAAEALAAARAILKQIPDHSMANLLAGNAYRQLGEMTRAEYHLKRGGRTQIIRDDLWSIEVLRYRVGYGSQVQLAIQFANDGQNEVALQMLESLRLRNADDVRVLAQLGQVLLRLGRQDDARSVLEDALQRHPEHFRVHLELSALHYVGGDAERALQSADRSIELRGEQALAHVRRGSALRTLKRHREAAEAFEEALRLDPGDARVQESLGDCLATLQLWDESAEQYAAALEQREDDAGLHVRYGMATLFAGQLEQSEQALERALALGPDRPDRVQQLLQETRRRRQGANSGE